MKQTYSIYKRIEINTSQPLKLVLMLYDGAINFLRKSIEYGEKKDIKNKNIYANRARDIIIELNNYLNMEAGGEIARNLRTLYLFMNRHLLVSNWNNDFETLREVIQMLSDLRTAWQEIYQLRTWSDHQTLPKTDYTVQHQRGLNI